MKKSARFCSMLIGLLLGAGSAAHGQVLFSDGFDASPDWQSAESFAPAANAAWPNTWADRPGGPVQPPPQNWTSYRAAVPKRDNKVKTFVLSAEAARNPGGKGMTYNLESIGYGTWVGGGIDTYLGGTGYKEMFVRFYLKFDPATFHWGTVTPNFGKQKVARISRLKVVPSTTINAQLWDTPANGSYQMPTLFPDLMDNPAYDTPPSSYGVHLNYSYRYDPTYYVSDGNNDVNVWNLPWPSDGGWHCYEYRVKMNSAPGVADGEWEIWIDGGTTADHHFVKKAIPWVQAGGSVNPGWNWVTVLDNATIQPDIAYANSIMKLFLDDVVIATSYSGPPPAPVNFTAQASGSTTAHLQWTAGTNTVPFETTGYKVLYGLDRTNLNSVYDAGNVTQADIPNLQAGQTYYFAVEAVNKQSYDAQENVSLSSQVASVALGTSAPVADTVAPTASISSPATGSTVSGSVAINANASDNVAVSKVEFYVNGALYGMVGSAPYSVSWNTANLNKGSYQLSAKAYDAAGNVGLAQAVSVNVQNASSTSPAPSADTTAPAVSAFAMPATASALNVAVSSFSGSDNVGVTGYLITESATAPAASATGWTGAAPTSFSFAAAGARTAYAWVKDAAGNVSASRSAAVTITLPAATGPVVSFITPQASASVPSVTPISAKATSSLGIAQMRIYVDNTLMQTAYVDNVAYNWDTTTAAKGAHTLMVYAFDKSLNLTISKISVITGASDTTAPSVTSFVMPATATTLTVPISGLVASDNVGVAGYLVSENATAPAASATGWSSTAPASFSFAGEGARSAYAWAKDAAGNVSAAAKASVTITLPDLTAPVVAVTSPASGNSVAGTVTVTASARDNKGVSKVEFYVNGSLKSTATAAPYAFSWATATYTNGSYTLSAKAYDAARNVGQSAPVTASVNNDTTAPAISSFSMPATSTSTTVAVSSLSASDNVAVTGYLITESSTTPAAALSNWSASVPTSFIFSGSGARTAYAWAKDAAGNVSLSRSASVNITVPDTTPPVITVISPSAGIKVPNNLTISASAKDPSGVIQIRVYVDKVLMATTNASSISYVWNTTKAAAGTHNIEIWAFDSARNYGIAKVAVQK